MKQSENRLYVLFESVKQRTLNICQDDTAASHDANENEVVNVSLSAFKFWNSKKRLTACVH